MSGPIASSPPAEQPFRYPLWTSGDLDGFFGLMVDNLVQVLVIINLCGIVCGIPDDVIFGRILPGIAVSLLLGNLFYGIQAHLVARRDRNATCTALPYGVSTPTVFAFVLFVMGPVYAQTKDGDLAWKAGLVACFVSGVIETFASFFASQLRRITPRAALLGALAGIGITFIAADFAFRIYTKPLVGVLPLVILMLAYFAHYSFPLRLPGGLLTILVGTAAAWLMSSDPYLDWFGGVAVMSSAEFADGWSLRGWTPPVFVGSELLAALQQTDLVWRFLTVAIPMGLLNALGSLQNIESAEAGGDRFSTGPSMVVNGLGTVAAALFGSCFPTTIYIGHPGWKALGARASYSIANGVFFTVCFLLGLGKLLGAIIPVEAGAAIMLYIGLVICAQAFSATKREHAPAVALAIFPALAALLMVHAPLFLSDAGAQRTLAEMLTRTDASVATLGGMLALTGANSSWFILSLLLAAVATSLAERRFGVAAAWCAALTILTAIGLLHAYELRGNEVRELFIWQAATSDPTTPGGVYVHRGLPIALAYALATALLAFIAWRERRGNTNANDSVQEAITPDR